MKKELLELAALVHQDCRSAGADAMPVSLNGNRSVEISYRDRKPENIKEASTKGLGIEILQMPLCQHSTSDLRKSRCRPSSQCVAMTKLLAEDKFRSLPDPKYYEGRAAVDLKTTDPAYGGFTADIVMKS